MKKNRKINLVQLRWPALSAIFQICMILWIACMTDTIKIRSQGIRTIPQQEYPMGPNNAIMDQNTAKSQAIRMAITEEDLFEMPIENLMEIEVHRRSKSKTL